MEPIVKSRLEDLIVRNELENVFWIAKTTQVESLIQNGPQCGIVALCMALKYLNKTCSVDELMSKAKELNFTKSGEMFDVKYMYELGMLFTECKIVDLNQKDAELDLIRCILSSKLVLIPYDCDFNFEPCKKQGLKAHWALITGFSLPVDLNSSEASSQFLINDNIDLNVINLIENELTFEQVNQLAGLYKNDLIINEKAIFKKLIYVFCKHGKSKQTGVWSLNQLIESNKQIEKCDDIKCNLSEFNRPLDGDISKCLGSKLLVFT